MNYFCPDMTDRDINKISMLGLAHIGDSVYEIMTRTKLCVEGHKTVNELHKLTVSYVKATAQAQAVKKILPFLTEEETAVYKRGRNAQVYNVPKSAAIGEYHAATGLEALFGWLYLHGSIDRLNELYAIITEEPEDAT